MCREEIQSLISTNEVEKLMLNVRGQNVLLDRDVAMLYGVETRIVNQAVKNNPLKFPEGYTIELDVSGPYVRRGDAVQPQAPCHDHIQHLETVFSVADAGDELELIVDAQGILHGYPSFASSGHHAGT